MPEREFVVMIDRGMKRLKLSQSDLGDLTGIDQSTISRIMNGLTPLRYEDARKLSEVISGRLSSIPEGMTADSIATRGKRVLRVESESLLLDVARTMYEKGFSQVVVYGEKGSEPRGLLTELSILKLLLEPKRPGRDLRRLKVSEVDLEEPPMISADASLQDVASILLHYYAALVGREGKFLGIVTRADSLKLLWSESMAQPVSPSST
jgi:predicted transcriptional regulator